ncbi:tartrate-resistant acid phosphatase type 5a [Megalops cyprinoides]|uniref:tartrate-resistant acid phosphatase type 5a n=1 Tax=Megalops cyprinoides TaxID=118141 RepID=UPI001864A2BD|nr:tartrate-resistant acid phosphatase type 5a [Megalops cyprinoides]
MEDYDRNRSSIRFLAVGDWGGLPNSPYITPIEKATAVEMGKVADQMGADFVLALGDNFYYKGVTDVNDPRFEETFESVFTANSLNIPWYVVAGNHDHAGNVTAQIEYSSRSERWHFPCHYYELNFRVPRTDSTLTILMVDTVLLCGNSDDFADEKPRGPLDAVAANRQLRWLHQRMERSKADFLLVAGHYPVWSVSEHGPTECLLKRLRPLLVKHKATAFFCGHDHNLQYLKESGVGYVVSGAGNFMEADMRHRNQVPRGSLKFFAGQESTMGGFAHVEVTKKQMVITFFQARGTSLYRTTLSKRDIDDSGTPYY